MDKKRRWIQVICIPMTLIAIFSGCGTWIKDRKCEHDWDSGVVTIAATCSSEGEKKYTCKDCGEKKVEAVAKNNIHSADIIDRIEPTCTKDGKDYGVFCSDCKAVLVEQKVIPALGHNFNLFGYCKTCGIYDASMDDDSNWTANY